MLIGFKALDKNISSAVIRSEKEFIKQREQAERTLNQLKAAENILNVLRPIAPIPRKIDQQAIEKWMAMIGQFEKEGGMFNEAEATMLAGEPNTYMAQKCPIQIKTWGPAFFGNQEYMNGRSIFIPESINDLAFAAMLGAPCPGCQVVYHPAEDQWYHFDYRVNAFCPTTEEKLGILVSHLFIQCSQHCQPLTAKSVLKLRTPQTIKAILTTARAMLEADARFFSGNNGHRRYVQGKYIEPNDEPSYQMFVRKAIVREPAAKLTMGTAFHRYYQFCKDQAMQPLTRSEFKDLVAEVIREEYDLGLRHDVLDERGKQTHGWLGIDCRLADASCFGKN